MAPTLPKDVVAAIEFAITLALKQGRKPDHNSIAAVFNTTEKTVRMICKRLRRFEETGIDDRKKPGPKPLRNQNEDELARFVRDLAAEHPGISQIDVAEKIETRFGAKFSAPTVSVFMKKHGIPHKRTNKMYARTQIVSTHPEGYVMPLEQLEGRMTDVERGMAGRGVVVDASEYSSPYTPDPRGELGDGSGQILQLRWYQDTRHES